jgi:malonate-semialdehyde dehydrogenase (acetylating)/methylmalonate-semialdehyde dehydrogenase
MEILFRFRELLNANKPETRRPHHRAEHGKVLSDALGEVSRGQEVVEFACGNAHLLKGAYSEQVSTGVDVYSFGSRWAWSGSSPRSTSRPWCRCGSSRSPSPPATPWSSSPVEKDPSAAMYIADLWKQAGLPDGVFNVVHGDKVAVDALLTHPDQASSRSSAPPRSRSTSTRPAPRTASGCRPSAAPRTTCSSCPTPTSI